VKYEGIYMDDISIGFKPIYVIVAILPVSYEDTKHLIPRPYISPLLWRLKI